MAPEQCVEDKGDILDLNDKGNNNSFGNEMIVTIKGANPPRWNPPNMLEEWKHKRKGKWHETTFKDLENPGGWRKIMFLPMFKKGPEGIYTHGKILDLG